MPRKKDVKICDIIDDLKILSENGNMTKEVKKISWNERPSVIDIRTWYHNDTGDVAGKGISLNDDECHRLCKILIKLGYDQKVKKVKKYEEEDE